MNTLPLTTVRRLKKIPQTPSVWEGDRRPLTMPKSVLEPAPKDKGECIIWVDGTEGFVRAMDVVSPEMGLEAVVRTLLRAIEMPHSPARPARPQKIVVRDRQIQFFLRGALQSLDIAIDYVPDLPLVDELFRNFELIDGETQGAVSQKYEELLREVAGDIWQSAPWELLADYEIIAIELNRWDVGTVYACVMGMMGREYGIILYRSLNSMKQFRTAALEEESSESLEKAFLGQDCWFLNFEAKEDEYEYEDEDEDDEDWDIGELPMSEIRPLFGSIHPYEGMRPLRDEEEAMAVYISLLALREFINSSRADLERDEIGVINKRFSFPLFPDASAEETVSVNISTMPNLADELIEMLAVAEKAKMEELPFPLKEDLIPQNSFLSLGMLSWDVLISLKNESKVYVDSPAEIDELQKKLKVKGLPIIVVQTTRPKAKELITELQKAGGIKGICFNPGEDSFNGTNYDLGIIQTGDKSLYLFGEFVQNEPDHLQAMEQWNKRSQQTNGHCGLIVAMGVTGSSRGNPQMKDMMAFFGAKVLDGEELGMGILELDYEFDYELD
jgi:hypothetical protein